MAGEPNCAATALVHSSETPERLSICASSVICALARSSTAAVKPSIRALVFCSRSWVADIFAVSSAASMSFAMAALCRCRSATVFPTSAGVRASLISRAASCILRSSRCASSEVSATFCERAARSLAAVTADSLIIWLATMPIASRTPTAPAKPSLFPIRLSLIMSTTPNFLKQVFRKRNLLGSGTSNLRARPRNYRQRSRDRLISACAEVSGCSPARFASNEKRPGSLPEAGALCLPPTRSSGGPDRIQKPADFELEAMAVARQRLRRREHLRGGGAGLAGTALHVRNVGGNLLGSAGGLLHVARNFLRRRALLFHGSRDRRGDLRQPFNGAADFLDRIHRLLGRALNAGNLLADLAGGFCRLFRERLHFRRHDRKAAAGVAGARRLDGGVERQQIGLARDGVDEL